MDITNKNSSLNPGKVISNEAPGWLRLIYVKEVLPRFVLAEEDDDIYRTGDKFSGLIGITGLAEKLCVMLKTELPRAGHEWEYITEKIKKCHWQQFYEIIEMVGKILLGIHVRLAERYIKYKDDQDSEELFFLADEVRELEIYGYEAYQSAVTALFVENSIDYALGEDGRLISLTEVEAALSNEPASDPARSDDEYAAKLSLSESKQQSENYRDAIEETLVIIRNTDLLDDKHVGAVETGLELFNKRKYQETSQLLFPSIEHALNSMLIKAGEEPKKFPGFMRKIEWLENRKHLPALIKNFTPIVEGRNLTVHGNLSIADEKLGEDFCLLLIHYLCFLIKNYAETN